MTTANPEAVEQLNEVTKKRIELEAERIASKQQYEKLLDQLATERANELAEEETRVAELDTAIWTILDANRDNLIARGRKSFVTAITRFQLREQQAKVDITNTKLAITIARTLGVVRKIGKLKVGWVIDKEKFTKWLDQHGEYREDFADCIEDIPASETLTIKPNTGYTVYHNGERLSASSISIKRS